jgi:hypothetical protein
MPENKLQVLALRPGVNREGTSYAGEGGFYACDKIRFRSGLPEKLGGWTPYSNQTYLGSCKLFVEWLSLSNYYLLGLGTNLKFYILVGGVYYDITPIRYTSTLGTNAFYSMYDTLSAGISATDTVLPIVGAVAANFDLLTPFVVQIGSEKIFVPYVDTVGNTLGSTSYPCVRGYEGTTAAIHAISAPVSSSWVIVDDPGNGATVDDFVTFSGVTAFSGFTAPELNQEFQVKSKAGNYISFDIGVQSTVAAQGGGAVATAAYQLATGLAYTGLFNGWGAGPWGTGHGWNTGYSGTGIAEELRLWSAANFGQDLYFNVRNGGIYYWSAATGLSSGGQVTARGINITSNTFSSITAPNVVVGNYYEIRSVGTTNFTLIGASANTVGVQFVATGIGTGTGVVFDPAIPSVATCITVTDERYLVAFGCNDAVNNSLVQDPMLIAWSDQENPQVWYPQITNTAGNFRLAYGSRIVTIEKTRQEILVWTDAALYSMQYLGPPYVYSFNPISVDTTIVSQNAMATAAGVTYWMGDDKFYAYSGRVDTLPCALRQYVFDDINNDQLELVCAGTNEKYNEIWWFYPSTDSVFNDRYVIYNYLEKIWYYGTMERSAWFDSHIIGNPVGAVNNLTVQHETGTDDGSVNPIQPIAAYIESADFDLGDGGYQFSFVKRLIPDMDFIGSSNPNPQVTMTLKARNYPGQGVAGLSTMQNTASPISGAEVSTQVYNYTQEVWIRIRGRQLVFRVESDQLGVKWQLGSPRLQIQTDGRR